MKFIKYFVLIVSINFLSLRAAEEVFDSGSALAESPSVSYIASVDPGHIKDILRTAAERVLDAEQEAAQAQERLRALERQLEELTLGASVTAQVTVCAHELEGTVNKQAEEIRKLTEQLKALKPAVEMQSALEDEFSRMQDEMAQMSDQLAQARAQQQKAQEQLAQEQLMVSTAFTDDDIKDDDSLVKVLTAQVAALEAVLLKQQQSMSDLEAARESDREEKERLALQARLAEAEARRLATVAQQVALGQDVSPAAVTQVVFQPSLDLAALAKLAELEQKEAEMEIAKRKLREYQILMDEERRAQLPNPNPEMTEDQKNLLQDALAELP